MGLCRRFEACCAYGELGRDNCEDVSDVADTICYGDMSRALPTAQSVQGTVRKCDKENVVHDCYEFMCSSAWSHMGVSHTRTLPALMYMEQRTCTNTSGDREELEKSLPQFDGFTETKLTKRHQFHCVVRMHSHLQAMIV